MNRVLYMWKQKWILLQIKREIRVETLAITRKAGIKKNSEQYFLIQEDVIKGKPHFMGDSYKIPVVSNACSKNNNDLEQWHFISALEYYLIKKLKRPVFNKRC